MGLTVITGLVAVFGVVLLLPTLSDLASLARAVWRRPRRAPAGPTSRILFLVPAHNEELMIESCVRSIRALDYPADHWYVVVVADNCNDRTADIARGTGARCLERTDPERPGKAHAIAWALDRLPLVEYDAVVIVDADCVVDPRFARSLADEGPLASVAVQPYNDVLNPDDSPLTRLASLFAAARFRLAYPLKSLVGLSVPLSAGMCLGTAVLRKLGWGAFTIGEDWEMYARLTAAGVPIRCAPRAHLYAQETRSLHQSSTQRQRWTAGRLTVLGHYATAIIRSARIGWHQKLDVLGELAVPGPVLHAITAGGLAALVVALGAPGADLLAFCLVASVSRPAIYSVAALVFDRRPAHTLTALFYLPLYAVWRVAIAIRSLMTLGDRTWVRTERHVASR